MNVFLAPEALTKMNYQLAQLKILKQHGEQSNHKALQQDETLAPVLDTFAFCSKHGDSEAIYKVPFFFSDVTTLKHRCPEKFITFHILSPAVLQQSSGQLSKPVVAVPWSSARLNKISSPGFMNTSWPQSVATVLLPRLIA